MKSTFRTIVRWALGLTFLVAGGMKLSDPVGFFSSLAGYGVPFPEFFLRVVAAGLPWLELLTGLGLIFNFWPETIRPMVCVLWLIFVVMLGQALWRGLELDCSCFGAGGHGWFERLDVAFVRASLSFAASLYLAAGPTVRSPNRTH